MKNIIKLIKNTDFSFDMQSRLLYHIQKCSIGIDRANKAYVQGKKLLTETDAALIKAIVNDDYEAKEAAEHDIVEIVKSLAELRHVIKAHTAKNKSFFKMVMNHQVPAHVPVFLGTRVSLGMAVVHQWVNQVIQGSVSFQSRRRVSEPFRLLGQKAAD